MKQLRVKDLYKKLEKEIKKGNGDKLLITADDVEGNGYHGIWFGPTDAKELEDKHSVLTDCETDDWGQCICIG